MYYKRIYLILNSDVNTLQQYLAYIIGKNDGYL